MEIKSPILKKFIMQIVFTTGKTKLDGSKELREYFPMNQIGAIKSLKDLLLASVSYGSIDKALALEGASFNEDEIEWSSSPNPRGNNRTIIAERYNEEPINLSDEIVGVIKYYYRQMESFPTYAIEIYDEINEMFKSN